MNVLCHDIKENVPKRMMFKYDMVTILVLCTLNMAVLWKCDGDAVLRPAVCSFCLGVSL